MDSLERAREALTAIRKASAMDAVVMSAPPAAVSRFADIHQHADAALAALSRSVEGVKGEPRVKPLEFAKAWGPDADGDENHTAATPFGSYTVERWSGKWRWKYCFDEYYDEDEADCDSLDDGIALARAHWVDRVSPILAAPPVADSEALRERLWEANADAGLWEDAHRELLNAVMACCDPELAVCGLQPGPEREALEDVVLRQHTFHSAKGPFIAEARLAQADQVPAVTEAMTHAAAMELYGYVDKGRLHLVRKGLEAALQQSAAGEEGK